MKKLAGDLKYALRMLRKQLGFTIVALATIAAGVGANTAVFSILYAVLLQPLPYPDADRLVVVQTAMKDRGNAGASRLDFDDWRAQSRTFASLAAYRGESADVLGGSRPQRVVAIAVSGGFFETFGVKPLVGRTFDAEREGTADTPPAVISERFWKEHFGAAPNVAGRVLRIAGNPHVVVGVLPASFTYPWEQDVWLPLVRGGRDVSRSGRNYKVVGRLNGNADLEAARAEMSAIGARLAQTYPDTNGDTGISLQTLRDELTASVRPTLWLLFAVVALVLAVACANLAGLLLARGRARASELAVRSALGASTRRIVRQLLTETLVLALLGSACGVLVAFWVSRLLARSAALTSLHLDGPLLNVNVLLFALALSFATAAVSGVVPALRLARAELPGRGLHTMMRRDVKDPFRRHLVAAEVALAVVLLVAAGLITRSMLRLQTESLGFDPRAMRIMTVNAPDDANAIDFYGEVLQRVRSLPGVTAAAVSSDFPLGGEKTQGGVAREGWQPFDEKSWVSAGWQFVSEDYFHAMSIPILHGRAFSEADRGGGKVAIVSETFVRRYFPDGEALGKRVTVPGLDSETNEQFQHGTIDWLTVVGVAGDVRAGGPASEPMAELYLPYSQHPASASRLGLAVRSSVAAGALDRMLEATVHDVAPEQPVRIRSYEERLETRLAAPRLRSQLIVLFAFLAIVLAGGGLYGVTAQWVEQRRREIGIRIAHGAKPRHVLLLFIRRSVASTLWGIVAGVAAAVWLAGFLVPFLFRTPALDPTTFGVAILFASLMAVVATFVPARRASRVNPVETLRYE